MDDYVLTLKDMPTHTQKIIDVSKSVSISIEDLPEHISYISRAIGSTCEEMTKAVKELADLDIAAQKMIKESNKS